MELIQYDPKYRQRFIELNTAWIKNNFGFPKEEDPKTFQEIAKGAMIFFAVETDTVLKPALHIYQKYGFQEIKPDDCKYVRENIAFEYIVRSSCREEANDI